MNLQFGRGNIFALTNFFKLRNIVIAAKNFYQLQLCKRLRDQQAARWPGKIRAISKLPDRQNTPQPPNGHIKAHQRKLPPVGLHTKSSSYFVKYWTSLSADVTGSRSVSGALVSAALWEQKQTNGV